VSEKIDLKELERKAYRSFFEDGIWDIYLGLLLLAMGAGPGVLALDVSPAHAALVGLALSAVALVIFFAGKKRLTIPRLGRVRFGPARALRKKKTTFVLACSALLGVALLVVGATRSLPSLDLARVPMVAIIFGANCIIVFGLGAYYLDFGRLYAYGLLYAAAFPLGVVLHEQGRMSASFLVAYGLMAAPMLLIGLVLLFRFLRQHPAPAERTSNGAA